MCLFPLLHRMHVVSVLEVNVTHLLQRDSDTIFKLPFNQILELHILLSNCRLILNFSLVEPFYTFIRQKTYTNSL